MRTIGGAGKIGIEVVFVPARPLVVAAKHVGCERVHGDDCRAGRKREQSASDSEVLVGDQGV